MKSDVLSGVFAGVRNHYLVEKNKPDELLKVYENIRRIECVGSNTVK
jgi:hypothetical protein